MTSCEMLLIPCYNTGGFNGVGGLYLYGIFKIIAGCPGGSGEYRRIHRSYCEKFQKNGNGLIRFFLSALLGYDVEDIVYRYGRYGEFDGAAFSHLPKMKSFMKENASFEKEIKKHIGVKKD